MNWRKRQHCSWVLCRARNLSLNYYPYFSLNTMTVIRQYLNFLEICELQSRLQQVQLHRVNQGLVHVEDQNSRPFCSHDSNLGLCKAVNATILSITALIRPPQLMFLAFGCSTSASVFKKFFFEQFFLIS